MTQTKTILAVLAHPDDESFGMGGTLALYAKQGHHVYLACATRGEVGSADAEFMQGFKSVAEMRESELRCAAGHLGLKEVFFLGYRDSGMPGSPENEHPDAQVAHPVEEVAKKVVQVIRSVKPDVVITFDPIGGYRHPDHIHIHNATVLAFNQAGEADFAPELGKAFSPAFLYFHTFPRGFLRLVVRTIRLLGGDPSKWGRNKDIDLASLAEVDFPTHVRIDYSTMREKKMLASHCHASQGGREMGKGIQGLLFRLLGQHDDFMQAHPQPAQNARIRNSLFE